MKLIRLALGLCALLGAQLTLADTTQYPLTIKSCNREVTLPTPRNTQSATTST